MTEPKSPVTDLCERMETLRLRYNLVFNTEATPDAPPYIPMAEALVKGLADGDPAAVNIARAVVGFTELSRPEFWGTPLGRLMFAGGCFPSDQCSQATAALVLSCSRQWVSAMLAEGKLTQAEWRGVYVHEVRQMMRLRAARLNLDGVVK